MGKENNKIHPFTSPSALIKNKIVISFQEKSEYVPSCLFALVHQREYVYLNPAKNV